MPEKFYFSSSPFLPLLSRFLWSVSQSTIGLLGIYPYYKLTALLFGGVVFFRQWKKDSDSDGNPNGLPLPPGPKGYPLIGNLFDMPISKAWVVYDEWRKTYGKTCHDQGSVAQLEITGNFR